VIPLADSEPVTPAQVTPVIVTLPAEIDMANECGVAAQLGCALASGAPVVVADMTGTRFCDSMGRALALAHRQAAARHAELAGDHLCRRVARPGHHATGHGAAHLPAR
jgi:anti-anti-sigma regulatory factor